MKREKVSDAVVRRLPKYYRCLKEMEESGKARVSSNEISKILNVTASQVRQDFANFGEFGQQGYGYDVCFLKEQIQNVLGLNREYRMIIVGGGHIGTALASYLGFVREGFKVLAVFDIAPEKVHVPEGIAVLHVDELARFSEEHEVDIAVIATPRNCANEVANAVVDAGISAIWNFAPCDLTCGKDVAVENINMSESLFLLSYKSNLSREELE